MSAVEFRVLELINARLCHELVSPVGAINNGVELLDEDDADFVRDAIQLIGQSARKAGQRLQFYRFAYGTSASGGAASGRDLALGLLEGGKVRCDWSAEATTLPAHWQRLACNMLVLAADALPRGGTILVRPLRAGASGIEVTAEGEAVNLGPELRGALDPAAPVDELTSRTVHAYFTQRLAQILGATVAIAEAEPQRAVFRATAGSAEQG
ncbi:MAG TPA: histidine phosphotransferase family protein [Stellaceae bacterium]|jgi:histidine phosphotransferase ChpT|nr:histidine phosphotransferase family protein [Stellaceae bacterium]